nr:hypothetical protein [Mucilaginibacter rubeus]
MNWEHYVNQQQNFLSDLYKMIRLAYSHQSNVYYSREQLSDFIHHCTDLDENFTASIGNQLSVVLENASAVSNHNYVLFSVQFAEEGSHLIYAPYAALQFVQENDKVCLLSLNGAPGNVQRLKVSAGNFEKLDCQIINNSTAVIQWFADIGEPRVFHFSNKHGENGVGHWPSAAPLLCSREQAQNLLNEAIADFAVKKRFFKYDEDFNTYIEFFYEGDNTQKQWHGFHITVDEWPRRVPNSVRIFFNR